MRGARCSRAASRGDSDRPRRCRAKPGLGPLAGINAALHCAAARSLDAVLTAPCDTPSLPPDIAERLTAAVPAVFVESMPVTGLWPAAFAAALDAYARSNDGSVRGWGREVEALPYILDEILPNVNSLADLNRLSGHFP
ncbi:NTP transferase domain-containing protein [Sphingomonas sp. JC676]|nr:NTP transferase domain-containing protein [Sphingomonas sp. JC676]